MVEIFAFVLGISFIILGVGIGIKYDTNPLPTIFIVVGILICTCVLSAKNNNKEPSAIDVYRGNTTLQITYRDSIPVDTVVVFKK